MRDILKDEISRLEQAFIEGFANHFSRPDMQIIRDKITVIKKRVIHRDIKKFIGKL